jgi:deoxyxylulose-5-phosphate synthase
VLECVAERVPVRAQFQVMGVPDEILEHMSRKQVLEQCGLLTEHVVARFTAERRAPIGR